MSAPLIRARHPPYTWREPPPLLDARNLEDGGEAAEAVLREARLGEGREVDLARLERAALVAGHLLLDLARDLLDDVEQRVHLLDLERALDLLLRRDVLEDVGHLQLLLELV